MKVILGGGVSGLAAAYYLLKNSIPSTSIKLVEASHRLGGWIKTTNSLNGLTFEHGPRTIRPKGLPGATTLALVQELGLSEKVIPILQSHPAARNRLIFVKNNLHALPTSMLSLLMKKPPFTKPLISALFHDLATPPKIMLDDSIFNFVERRLGKEVADYLISPLICGICAGDAKEISVKFLMKSLFEAEQNHGSIVKGIARNMFKSKKSINIEDECALYNKAKQDKWSVWSLDGGLELLPKSLQQFLIKNDVKIHLNSTCRKLHFNKNGKPFVQVGQTEYECNHVISSLPASQLALLVRDQHPELGAHLAAIPTVSVVVVNLQYKGNVLQNDAFGFLVPASEKRPILGVVYDTCCFPKGDNTVLTVMMGGSWFQQLFGKNQSPEYLLNTAVSEVQSILKITDPPESYLVSTLHNCIPQYIVGHDERVKQIKTYIKKNKLKLYLVGSSYDGVGINDVILSSHTAVQDILHCY